MDLDFWDIFGREKKCLIEEIHKTDLGIWDNFGRGNPHLITE